MEKMPKKKYIFTLCNIDTEVIDQRYGISLPSNISEVEHNPDSTTQLEDILVSQRAPEVISFLDESKYMRKCDVSMVDVSTNKPLPKKQYSCFWCRHPIPENNVPIGCPIKYVPHQAVKTYYSELTKDRYVIKQNITDKRADILSETKDRRMSMINRGYYVTDGAFCSFNCCMAYIGENKRQTTYKESTMLLLKMYNNIHDEKVNKIIPAHHWRKLEAYGGNLTVEQFRNNFNKVEYVDYGDTINLFQRRIGRLFEEKLKF